ncbi:MAG: hypothetical protein BWY04_00496 [candidate division CPR1 bacterium ADurb.Bin160]|uniref:Uncharacterized protein n=1 Tax=candidate division CPR1 bacterium ADurb.Bin160 TaxID=1852826 RepID=A0A1V5ZNZ4_9BACT|nr:MAG: hypothetical protein BWY04_00496 [candidate division CPR1 bacterium ADurb.Bin160]
MSNSKEKGKSFEREICKKLSLWISNDKRDDIFWLTSGSGSRATTRFKKNKSTAYQGGDITFTDPVGEPLIKNFHIELKTGYSRKNKTKNGTYLINWCLLDILDSKQKLPIFNEFILQLEKDSEISKREPILIFRRQNREVLICIRYKLFNFIEKKILLLEEQKLNIININNFYYILKFSEFLEITKHDINSLFCFSEKIN